MAVVMASLLIVAAGARADSAGSGVPAGNLLRNPGAEAAAGAQDTETVAVPDWTVEGAFTAVQYGAPGFLTQEQSGTWAGGANFFGGGIGASSSAAQTVDVSAAAAEIDSGDVTVTLSALLGGYDGQDDAATVTARLLDGAGATLGAVTLGPVTRTDRGDATTLLSRTATQAVPAGTRAIVVRIDAARAAGSYNDGYADNLSLTLTGPAATGTPTPSATPSPSETATPDPRLATAAPRPTATPPGAPPSPTFHQTVVAAPLPGGTIRVRRPGSAGFETLVAGQAIPLGSTVDARQGTVEITSVPKPGAPPESARVYDGIFRITQTGSITEFTLTEALANCRRAHATAAKPKTRRLWGDGKGAFRTSGRYSSATVRGTTWLVQDSCAGTLTRVVRGAVAVRDNVRRRTTLVRAGHRYLARPKR